MMKLIIDIVLLAIIALCTWTGFRKGLVSGIAGILAIIIALFGGSLLSSAYAHEVVPALEPFVNGYIDSQSTRDAMLQEMGFGYTDLSLEDVLAQDSSLRYDYAVACMEDLGFYQARAQELADTTVRYANENNAGMTEAVVATLCDTVTYVGGLLIAFLMILIFLVAIGNVGNLSFRLPNLQALDELGGSLLGFVQGFLFCVLMCWVLSFLGLVIGKDTISGSTLGRFFLAFKFITNGLM